MTVSQWLLSNVTNHIIEYIGVLSVLWYGWQLAYYWRNMAAYGASQPTNGNSNASIGLRNSNGVLTASQLWRMTANNMVTNAA